MTRKLTRVVEVERVEKRILSIRGRRVMLDADLARLYGVTTKRLNQQVRRNPERFPADFMFQLTSAEKNEVVANCDHLRSLKFSPQLPQAFTEHGAVMLASVLNSAAAVQASLYVVRAFVHLRALLASHLALARKIKELEARYDGQFKAVFIAIQDLIDDSARKRPIGFEAPGLPGADA